MARSSACRSRSEQAMKLRLLPIELARRVLHLSQTDETLLKDEADPASMLTRLTERRLLWEAVRLLSYALPEREAVWWACMCVVHTAPPIMAQIEMAALSAAKNWVRHPCDETRRNAALSSAAAGYDSGAAWAARAAFASRHLLPLHWRGGKRVVTAVLRAGLWDDGGDAAARAARFIKSGRDIAQGGSGWLPPEREP